MVDRRVVARKLEQIEQYHGELQAKQQSLTREDLRTNTTDQRAVERMFELAIQTCSDLALHIAVIGLTIVTIFTVLLPGIRETPLRSVFGLNRNRGRGRWTTRELPSPLCRALVGRENVKEAQLVAKLKRRHPY